MIGIFWRYLPWAFLAALCMIGEVTADLVQPSLMRTVVDDGILGGGPDGVDLRLVSQQGLMMILAVLCGGIFGGLCNYFVQKAAQNSGNAVRKRLFRHVMGLGCPETGKVGTGMLVTRITNDVTQLERLVSMFARGMVRTVMMMTGSIVFMFMLSPDFGMLTLMLLPFLLLVLLLCVLRANPLFVRLQRELERVNAMVQEDLLGVRVIKAFVRESYEKLRFEKVSLSLLRTQMRILIFFAFMSPAVNALMNISVALLLLEGGARVSAGSTTPGAVMAAITYITMLINSMMMLLFLAQHISRGLVSGRRIAELLRLEPSVRSGSLAVGQGAGQVSFEDVSFAYPGSSEKALEHISLTFPAGRICAVMGPTGSGKSTLLQLIPRCYDPHSGTVRLDGTDVRDLRLDDLRREVSLAPQSGEIFSMSVAENLLFGSPVPDDPRTIERMHMAADTAGATEFIERLESGFETAVSQRGAGLSGGQRQRLSLARALMPKARVLLLDDTTSALDLATEAAVLENLRRRCAGVTVIMVTQRIAATRQAAMIVLLDEGQVADTGTHLELLHRSQLYQDIYRSQYGDAALKAELREGQ